MKKIFLMLVAAFMVGAATMNAQVKGGEFILRGGFAANNFKGDNTAGLDMLPSYNISLDYNKNFYKGAYWNVGLMFGTRGFEADHSDMKFRAHNFNIPVTIGYKYNLTNNFAIDGRFGAFFGVDMGGKIKWDVVDDWEHWEEFVDDEIKIGDIDDYNRCDGGILLGLGVWYKRVNFEYTFKRGFGEAWDDGPAGAVNHMIRLGYAF